jgi:hypothetical protein
MKSLRLAVVERVPAVECSAARSNQGIATADEVFE